MLFVVFGLTFQNVRYFEKLSVNVQTGNLLMLLFAGLQFLSTFFGSFLFLFRLWKKATFFSIQLVHLSVATS